MSRWSWLLKHERFGGRTLYAPPGVRKAVARAVAAHAREAARVLDLASGAAVVHALREVGFTAIDAVARSGALVGDPDVPTPNLAEARELDLTGPFGKDLSGPYEVVVSSEVIEHLPAPRTFLRRVADLLEPEGLLILTTPNVSNWIGRLRFLVFGELRWFDEARARELNHISPITDAQMRIMLEETGFDLVHCDSVGSFTGTAAAILTAPLSLPFLLARGRRAWGDANLYVARARPAG